MAEEEFVEVCYAPDLLLAQMVVDEVLRPEGVEAVIRDRSSVMIPAPATMTGGFYVAVPRGAAQRAIAALATAVKGGVVPETLEVATPESLA